VNPSSLVVDITTPLIGRFAKLTGDASSLHVDDAFARRSAYRRPIAHGMLPVAFLAASDPFQRKDWRAVVTGIEGQFLAPVYAGDQLRVTATATRSDAGAGETEIPFVVENTAGTAVTRGVVRVAYEPRTTRTGPDRGGPATLLCNPLDVAKLDFADITIGLTDVTPFTITAVTIDEFADLVGTGARLLSSRELAEGCHIPNMLALMLFSTSVGIKVPGAAATFLEFSARFERPAALNQPYDIRGTVTHRSKATRIIKKEIVVAPHDNQDQAVLRGKVAVLVATPSRAMPSISDLRDAGVDWGLAGKVAIVTGASRGIGETAAKLLAVHGAKVVVNYHRGADDASRVVAEITASGGDAVAIGADVADEAAVRGLVQQARERFGGVDILVNNAARDFRPIPFANLTWAEIQKDIDVIAKGAFLCCQSVVPVMLERGGGKIINISTVAADNPPPDQMKYVMAKSALVGLTRSLSIELAPRNIQVNLVVPNFVETDFVAHIQDGFRQKIAHDTPMQRHASPIDVARAIVFLASAHSSFTTGQKLMVTGGGAPYL
jgi:3-oxoacyl-[acyl-carrier protein] reductase